MNALDGGLSGPWAEAVGRVAIDPGMAGLRDRFLAKARQVAAVPIVQRVYRLDDVGKTGRSWLDGRTWISPENTREAFALAMADFQACKLAGAEMPLLAAACRISGDRLFLDRVVAQLEEMAAWSPLQRPGWTLYHAAAKPIKDPKGDGNWLATGVGVLAIIEALEILPAGALPPDLVTRLDALLAKEIEGCLDDWSVRRPWFYKPPNPFTNQWVLPTAGYLLASLHLGRDRYAAAYELGVEHLLMSLDACGTEGAFAEGLHYSMVTVEILLSTARLLAQAGDERLISHPFLARYPSWVVQHYQPGGHFINAFDAFGGAAVPVVDGKRSSMLHHVLALSALCTDNADARWALRHLEADGEPDLVGLLAPSGSPATREQEPPRWAVYDVARRVNWRSSWRDDATGVWIRGGHPSDQHDHADRGHVNLILNGHPVLIEAGTPAYHNPRLATDYASGRGHNVLQVGERLPDRRSTAPLSVVRLDAAGGDITVDATGSFKDGVRRWIRRVQWDARQMTVTDDVELAAAETLLLRWHLGTSNRPDITAIQNGFRVRWPEAMLEVLADVPICADIEPMPDHTLRLREWDDPSPEPLHACLVVTTVQPVARARFTLTAEPPA